jgi:phage shock protein PspC (stress-responsive transcriptional regulator)
MQKVISINLNGNAYQLEEGGYDALREYLASAERELAGNPDRAEVMSDLEQAIADRCRKFLGPHKSVVTTHEIEEIVREMGPIEAPGEAPGSGGKDNPTQGEGSAAPPKRLYRIQAGAMIAGVCTGLATYFGMDVALIRTVFVVVAILTKGAAIVAYIVMMFVIPEASTPEERASAGGNPFNARDVIERAKKQYADGTRQWRRQWRQQQRQWHRAWAHGAPVSMPLRSRPPSWAAAWLPIFTLAHLALFVITLSMVISLVNNGAIMTWDLPPDVPVWAGVLILLIAYQIVVSPFRVASWFWEWRGDVMAAPFAFWNAVIWLIGVAFCLWFASEHVPEIREFLQRLPDVVREFAFFIRDLVSPREPR